jgi:hypothetical protein
LALSLFISSPALAWHDATHMAVMKAAGLDNYSYLAVGADMAKDKSGGYEDGNHYRDNLKGVVVTVDMVLDQVRDYNCRCNDEGHLYGAIIAALNQYREGKNLNKYARYPLGFAAHYIGDLSMPLHNVEYNTFNKTYHSANDGVVEGDENEPTDAKVARIAKGIQERMKKIPPYQFPPAKNGITQFNLELAKKIAEIANKSINLGYSMQESNPQRTMMSTDEAYGQLAESAALLKAAFAALQ